jgi:hypothetical protein
MSRTLVDAVRDGWRKRLERFARSRLPVVEFCLQEGVSVASFYYWRKKLGLPEKLGPDAARPRPVVRGGAFRTVRVVPPVPGVFVHLAGGARIEVRAEDLDTVRAVVAEVLRAEPRPAPDGLEC